MTCWSTIFEGVSGGFGTILGNFAGYPNCQSKIPLFKSLVNFVNKGSLGDPSDFRRYFEKPILRGRDSFATAEEHELGNSRLKELLDRVNKCMLRRTAEILIEYLPIKHELIIAVPLTEIQKRLYICYGTDMANLQNLKSASERKQYKQNQNAGSSALQVITYLRKICAHPTLMYEALTNPDSAIPVNDKNWGVVVLETEKQKPKIFLYLLPEMSETEKKTFADKQLFTSPRLAIASIVSTYHIS